LGTDQRNFFAISRSEPRINFALNPGSSNSYYLLFLPSLVSGASLRIYHYSTIFEELEDAARTFLQEKSTIDEEKKEVSDLFI
jgi:hypothetical protein